MVDRKPDLAALTRVSYLRELRGDRRGALDALRAAQSAGGQTAESTAFVAAARERPGAAARAPAAARRAAREALHRFAGYAPAEAALAKADAARGRHRRRDRAAAPPRRPAAAARARDAAGRARARRGPPRRRAPRPRPRARRAAAAARGGRGRRHRGRGLRGRPRRPARRRSCSRAARGRRRRACAPPTPLGWALTRAGHPRGGPALGAARAAPRLARPDGAAARRASRAARAGDAAAAARAWLHDARARRRVVAPWQAARARARAAGADERAVVMRRALLVAAVLALALPAAAGAHPLGNFTVNRLDVVTRLARPRRRPLGPRPGRDPDVPRARPGRRRRCSPASAPTRCAGCASTVDGRPRARCGRAPGRAIALPRRARAACRTTRVELRAARPPCTTRARSPCATTASAAGSAGARSSSPPGAGTAVRSDVPPQDVTRGLRAYPKDLLGDPADVRAARLASRPAAGRSRAPRARGAGLQTTGERGGDAGFAAPVRRRRGRPRRPASCCCSPRSAGARCTRCRPGTARRWSPPTSSARAGRRAHAVALGATVTVAHTTGVFALGRRGARRSRSGCCPRTCTRG